MVVINVPGWFGTLYAIVKPLLNEAQRAKINVFKGDDVLPGMRTIIDDDNIPQESVCMSANHQMISHLLSGVLRLGGSSPVRIGHMPEEKALQKYTPHIHSFPPLANHGRV